MKEQTHAALIDKFLFATGFTSTVITGLAFLAGNIFLRPVDSSTFQIQFQAFVLISGFAWLLMAFFFVVRRKRPVNELLLAFSAFNMAYWLSELLIYISLSTGLIPFTPYGQGNAEGFFNKACMHFDPVSGYKWLQEDCRITTVANGKKVFDVRFSGNNKGYLSQRDYYYKKADTSAFRYLVFGDSFTAAEFLETNWPDKTQELIDSSVGRGRIELYNFAIDGGGLVNWHNIFFEELVPNYNFDGIILAVWGNDLARDFFVMHPRDSKVFSGYVQSIPPDLHTLETEYFDKLLYSYRIMDEQAMERQLEHELRVQKEGIRPPALNVVNLINSSLHALIYEARKKVFEQRFFRQKSPNPKPLNETDLISHYGKQKFAKLDTMLTYCRDHKKSVILCKLPYRRNLEYTGRAANSPRIVNELDWLGQTYNARVFDGISPFREISPSIIPQYFIYNDLHWNLKGSDLFAKEFAGYLRELHIEQTHLQ